MKTTLIRKGFLKRILLGLGLVALAAALCAFDAFFIEPNFPRVIRQEVFIRGLPESLDGLKIVQLTDLHIVRYGKREGRALRKIRRLKPDLICLTGDYIQDDGITKGQYTDAYCIRQAVRFVSRLDAKHGVYGVCGNWDPRELAPAFERAGVRMIDKDSVVLTIRQARLKLSSDTAVGPPAGRESSGKRIPTIVLDHFPDAAEDLAEANAPVDLVLAGHWHGCQVSWPIFGCFDAPSIEHPSGLYRIGRLQLYVSRGLGMHTYAVRFNCPSEITLIVLRPA